MGPNGSVKTYLANNLMWNKKYKIKSGKIFLDNKNITNLPVNKRAEKGIFVSYQNPIEVPGVSV